VRDAVGLVPRKVLLGDPKRSQVQISPDGKTIGWLTPVDGWLNLAVAPADDVSKATVVTHQTRSIRSWRWSFQGDRVLFVQDKGGDESAHVYSVDTAKHETKDLTPLSVANAEIVHIGGKRPQEALVSINDRDRKYPDLFSVDIVTGSRKLVAQNDGGYGRWVADDDFRVRFGIRQTPDGGAELVVPGHAKEPAKSFLRIPFEDVRTLAVVGFDKSGDTLYLEESNGRETSALFGVDTRSGSAKLLAEDAHGDAGAVLLNPVEKTVEAVSFEYDKLGWTRVDASVEGDFYYLLNFGDGRLGVTSRSLDEQHWLVSFSYTDGPTLFYRYDRDPDVQGTPGKATFLFRSNDDLEHAKLSATKPVILKARDGLDLVTYLTIPYDADPRDEGRPKRPLPLVMVIHDGPWARASGETNAVHQWLANRGYAVLSVNYRGSKGLGKTLLNAGNREWGGKMQDDLAAVARWAVDEKIAEKERIALLGEGYGGYAVLFGLASSPFACGVDIGGPTNLLPWVLNATAFADPMGTELALRVGDYRTDSGKNLLEEQSPARHLQSINRPVLIEQGKDDPRVAQGDTAEFAMALKAKRTPVTYVTYPDEARGLARAANRVSFGAVAEAFLAKCLDGPAEPVGDDFGASSITVPVGAEYLPGVRAALRPEQVEPPAPAPPASVPAASADAGSDAAASSGPAGLSVERDGVRGDGGSKPEADASRSQDGSH
jgi:dipeptidyl aminopeptidase/acylaminoacyl peptidase